jgi:murein L,D-transpeptidase YcbB/YkuD
VGTHVIAFHATDAAGNKGNATTTITVNSATVTLPPSLLASLSAADFQEMMIILKLIGISQSTVDSLTATYNSQHNTGASTTGTTRFVFTGNLGLGSLGDEVTHLQTTLAAKGYFSGNATGYYGPMTRAAVIAFQKANGLSQVGIVGPQTRAALNN